MPVVVAPQGVVTAPQRGVVGESVRVSVVVAGQARAGVEVAVEPPDGPARVLGVTGGDGSFTFVPDRPGTWPLVGTVDGVRWVSLHRVDVAYALPWTAAVSIPLGCALLWLHVRRWRRGSEGQP